MGLTPFDSLSDVLTSTQLKLPLDDIEPDPHQPRRHVDTDNLQALADNLAQRGLVDPIKVYAGDAGRYRILDGERRWRAARMCGWALIDVQIVAAPDEPLPTQVAANELHETLTPGDLLDAVARMVTLGMSQREIGHHVGRSRQWVNQCCRLNNNHPDLVDQVRAGSLSLRGALSAAGILKPGGAPTSPQPPAPQPEPDKKGRVDPRSPAHASGRDTAPSTDTPPPGPARAGSAPASRRAEEQPSSPRPRLVRLVASVEALVPQLTTTERSWLAGELHRLDEKLHDRPAHDRSAHHQDGD